MKHVIAFLCILKICQITAEVCSEYSVVFKYKESVPDQPFWEPLLPVDKGNPQLKSLFEKEKNCVLELDCEISLNLTGIISFTKEDPDSNVQNDDNHDPSGPQQCHDGISSSDCAEKDETEKYITSLECNEIDKSNNSKLIEIEIIPDDKCKGDCFNITWNNDDCIVEGSCGWAIASNVETTVLVKIDESTTEHMIGSTAAVESEEKNFTALFVIAAILSLVAGSALLFFGAKTVIAYFKSGSYNVGDKEANANQNIELNDKYD